MLQDQALEQMNLLIQFLMEQLPATLTITVGTSNSAPSAVADTMV